MQENLIDRKENEDFKLLILTKLESMINDSFEGWNEDSKKGYMTSAITIQQFILNN